jgi:hypothetical protein
MPAPLYPMYRLTNVPLRLKSSSLTVATLLCVASSAFATEYADLKRMEPVPSTEQIPIVDFVRPPLFDGVQLNHTGTRVGALVPAWTTRGASSRTTSPPVRLSILGE